MSELTGNISTKGAMTGNLGVVFAKDGVSVTHEWDGTTLTVTSASGTSSADLKGAKGDRGEKGNSGVYLGGGDMPDDCNVQIDPNGEPLDLMEVVREIISSSASTVRIGSVSLPASAWTGSGSLYSQVVTIDGVTERSQVNLTPTIDQMAIFYEKDITFITENDGGVLTVYVIGQKPQNDYTIQANIVEVTV